MKPEYIDNKIAKRIRERRRETGVSVPELARAAGVSKGQVKKYLAGQNRIPAGRLFRICALLDMRVDDLVEDEEIGVEPAIPYEPTEPFEIRREIMSLKPGVRRALRQVVRAAGLKSVSN